MSTYENETLRKRLGDELKRLRVNAGLSGDEMGAHLGVNQSTVSRIERGKQRASIRQVDIWCTATAATDERRQELLAQAETIAVGPKSWDEAGEAGSTNLQSRTLEIEARSRVLSFYQPVSIPGLLQTHAYAQRLLSSGPNGTPPDIAKRVMDRLDRQRILYDEGKEIRFVIPEVALRWPYGPPDDPAVMDEHLEQLARIEMAMSRPNVRIGILPLQPLAVWRLGGFVIYDEVEDDEPFVHLELLTRPFDESEPENVDFFRRTFANLMDAAMIGDEARMVLGRVIADAKRP
jgi:transcriptional regulator with XRE-family HTH domain